VIGQVQVGDPRQARDNRFPGGRVFGQDPGSTLRRRTARWPVPPARRSAGCPGQQEGQEGCPRRGAPAPGRPAPAARGSLLAVPALREPARSCSPPARRCASSSRCLMSSMSSRQSHALTCDLLADEVAYQQTQQRVAFTSVNVTGVHANSRSAQSPLSARCRYGGGPPGRLARQGLTVLSAAIGIARGSLDIADRPVRGSAGRAQQALAGGR
jgi:hypothetical protein